MTDYTLAETSSPRAIGLRARRLRKLTGMSPAQVAREARTTESAVMALEEGGDVSLAAALAIHRVLSAEGEGDTLFTRPRLRTIDEVEAFERRRLAGL